MLDHKELAKDHMVGSQSLILWTWKWWSKYM